MDTNIREYCHIEMTIERRKFTSEYKLRALDLMGELDAKQAAEKLGLNESILYNWI